MRLSPEIIKITGLAILGFLWILGFLKILRDDRLLVGLTFLSAVVLVIGIYLWRQGIGLESGTNPIGFLFGPIIYLLLFSCLRKWFLKKFKIEPTYNWLSRFDPEDGRNQKWEDFLVFILPVLASLLIPLYIALCL